MQYDFILPIYGIAKRTKKQKFPPLSMNWLLGVNYRAYGEAKKTFAFYIMDQISTCKPMEGKIEIRYTYFAKQNGTDLDNFICVVKKYFQDSLSKGGIIKNDSTSVIVSSTESFGGIDKKNPRVEAKVITIDD